MSPPQRQTEKAIAGLRADTVGDVIGRTLDHLRWVSVVALVAALAFQELRETYAVVLLLGAVAVAGIWAVGEAALR
ncbi:hypothetical protein [Halorussus ruber]|jgi:hypothetical protein|uniref:hypothetical protein n=1 Tax=Halorussus ruber TaxID=1126238 RepID=UPI001091E533|nr:hypothetical protein [Halorussus ruber]